MAEINRRGLMLVLSSPSGAGKTSICRELLSLDQNLKMSISATTRPRRPGEVHGVDYSFIDGVQFDELIKTSALLEYAKVFDYYYGTPRAQVEASLDKGQDVLFDIDWQGTQQLGEHLEADLVRVFILPPSIEDLKVRLINRGTDSKKIIKKRLERTNKEMKFKDKFDTFMINDDLSSAVKKLNEIITNQEKGVLYGS